MTDVRLVLCEHCGSEGRIIRTRSGHPNDPETIDCGPCPECGGTGRMLIEVSPIELEDLDTE